LKAASRQWLNFRPITPKFSASLNLVRWLAAGAVLLNHLRSIIFLDYNPSINSGLLDRAFYFSTGFGTQAVLIFFVLSGYLVGGEVARKMADGTFDWRDYLIRRAARIFAVYLAALMIGGVLDWCGITYFNVSGIYTNGVHAPVDDFSIRDRFTVRTLLGNIFFLQGLWVPPFGSNHPLWSLSHEVWYYLFFPLLVWPFAVSRFAYWKRFAALLLACTCGFIMRGYMLELFLIWLLGLVPFVWRDKWRAAPIWTISLIFISLVATRVLSSASVLYWPSNVILAAAFALYLHDQSVSQKLEGRCAPLHSALAGCSYSIYACHWPFVLFVIAILNQFFGLGLRMPIGIPSLACFALIGSLTCGWCFAISMLTERRTPTFRTWLSRVLPGG